MINNKYFLLIDDDFQDIEFFLEIISRTDYYNKVKIIRSGIEFYKYLNSLSYDNLPSLIFLDINMPVMDGFEVLQKIRKEKFLEHIPVVMLTSSNNNSDIVKAYELGCNGYIVKPLSIDEFQFSILTALDFWMKVNVLN